MSQHNQSNIKYNWLKKIGSYRIFTVPLENWLIIFVIFFAIFAAIYFLMIGDLVEPYHSEVFAAEVSKLWTEQYDNDGGGYWVYRVGLKQGETEFTCTVPPIFIKIWYQLEKGKRYEFEVSRSSRRCYINKVTEIETRGEGFGGNK